MNVAAEFCGVQNRVSEVVKWHKDAVRSYLQELLAAHYREIGSDNIDITARGQEFYLLVHGALAATSIHGELWPLEAGQRLAKERFEF